MLGRLYVKLAQEPSTREEAIMRQRGLDDAPFQGGGITTGRGIESGAALLTNGIAGLFGDDAAQMAQAFMPLLQMFLPDEIKQQLGAQYRTGTGVGTLTAAQALNDAQRQVNQRLVSRHGGAFVDGLAVMAKSPKVPDWMRGFIGKVAAYGSSSPNGQAILGTFINGLRQIPQFAAFIDPFFRHVPKSYAPLIVAATQKGGGVLDQRILGEMLDTFENSYKQGLYKDREGNDIDASTALGGVGLAATVFGEATTEQHTVEMARLADSLMKRNLVADSNMAYEMLRQMNPHQLIKNPEAFDKKMEQVSAQLHATETPENVPKRIAAAIQVAAKTGKPWQYALEELGNKSMMRQAWERSGHFGGNLQKFETLQAASEHAQTEGARQADTMKALAAYVSLSSAGRQAWASYTADPTPEKATALFAAARTSPTMHRRHAIDPSGVLDTLDPEQRRILNQGEQLDVARKDPLLQDIVRNPEVYKDVLANPASPEAGRLLERASRPAFERIHNMKYRGLIMDTMKPKAVKPAPYAKLAPYKQQPAGISPAEQEPVKAP